MVYLTGFPCTGKGSVGRALAAKRGVDFLDLDSYIANSEQQPIYSIFKEYGEERFRQLESDYLRRASAEIVACGGGVTLDSENLKWMKDRGTVVLLTATPTEIVRRLALDYKRPLLGELPSLEAVKKLLFARAYTYTQADIVVDTTDLDVAEVVKCLL
jgi:shikimate kinase